MKIEKRNYTTITRDMRMVKRTGWVILNDDNSLADGAHFTTKKEAILVMNKMLGKDNGEYLNYLLSRI